jgi:ABC-type multidrug transport system fused ATPase/permease subunit
MNIKEAHNSKNLLYYLTIYKGFLGPKIYLIFFLATIVALSEGFGIIMLLPLLQTLDPDSAKASSSVLGLIDGNLWYSSIGTNEVLIFIAILFTLKGIFSFFALSFNGALRGKLQYIILGRLTYAIQHSKYSFFQTKKTGYLVNLLNEQSSRAIQAFHFIEKIAASIVTSFIYLILAFLLNWKFGLMVLVITSLIYYFFRWINSYVQVLSRDLTEQSGIFANYAVEFIQGFKYLVSTGREVKIIKLLTESSKNLSGKTASLAKMAGFTQAFREPVTIVLIVSLIYIQMTIFQENLAPILVASLLLYRTMNSLLALQSNWQGVLEFAGGVEVISKSLIDFDKNKQEWNGGVLQIEKPCISINDLNFYHKSSHILNNLKIEAPFKSSIAIVGASGSGKSTLANIIAMLYESNSGSLLINGVPFKNVDTIKWRSLLGYVSQDLVIFSDTIANNISMDLGNQNNSINIESVKYAAKQAHIHKFIESLPNGYLTKAGDRGVFLSGGQRQRLAIARELYRRPQVLILDEATSALDSNTEALVADSIEALKGEMTIIVIAHRLNTVKLVDKIYVLDSGKVVENGSYKELSSMRNSKFRDLMKSQF